jgi:cell division protease FtsH
MDDPRPNRQPPRRTPSTRPPPPLRLSLLYLLLAFLVLLALQAIFQERGEKLEYSRLMELAAAGRIEEITIGDTEYHGVYRGDEDRKIPFQAVRPLDWETARLDDLLRERGVKVGAERSGGFGTILIFWMIALGVLVGIWYFGMRRMGNMGQQFISFGRSRAKIVAEKDTKTTFEDVAGCDEAKEELREIIQYLKEPKKFQALGAKVPKGVLLVGPPGTGKTLMARAVAGEASVPFYSLSGSDFVEMFVGVGAARVRDLFQQAKSKPPCIVFIDEIDAVGRHRGAGLGGGHDEREQTLNALLVELDGFEANKGVIIIAATNRPDVLDPALLRPGRFDRQVVLDTPEASGREAILRVHSRDKPLAGDVDLSILARRTPGFSGADLANVMNEAALLTGRRGLAKISMGELEEAIDRVVAGPERKSRLIRADEKRIIAYHEIGHALVAGRLPGADKVHKISIVPRGRAALGYTLQLPDQDSHLVSRGRMMDRISVALGGRVAEELVIGDISTGAQNDLEHVTDLARSMVCRFGMSDALGPQAFERTDGSVFLGKEFSERKAQYSQETLEKIDREIARVVDEAYGRTRKILEKDRALMDDLAERLMEKEIIDGKDFETYLREHDKSASEGEG